MKIAIFSLHCKEPTMSFPAVKPGKIEHHLPEGPLKDLNESILIVSGCHDNVSYALNSWSIINNNWYIDATTEYFFDVCKRVLYKKGTDGSWAVSKYTGYLTFDCWAFSFVCGKEVSQTLLCNIPLTRFVLYQLNATNVVIQLETAYPNITLSPFNQYPGATVDPLDNTKVIIPISSVVNYNAFRYSYINAQNKLIQVEVFTVLQGGIQVLPVP